MYLSNDFAGFALNPQRGSDIQSIRDNLLAAMSLQQLSVVDRSDWDRGLRKVLRLDALRQADRRFGPLREADGIAAIERRALDKRYGKDYRPCSAEEGRTNGYWQRCQQAEIEAEQVWEVHCDKFGDPYDDALVELIRTPSPDVFALRLKVELIAERDVTDEWIGRNILEMLAEESARLEGEELA